MAYEAPYTIQGKSLGEVAQIQSTRKPWSSFYTDDFFTLKNAFESKYGSDKWGLGFDPSKVPDDELLGYLNAYSKNVKTVGKSPITAIHAASEMYGLNDAVKANDLNKVRESLLKGSEYQFKNHGPSGKLIQKLAPLGILGAGALLTGGFGLSSLFKNLGVNTAGASATGNAIPALNATGIAGNITAPQFLASTAAGGAASSGGLLSSIANVFGGNMSSPMGNVLGELIKKVPTLVDNIFSKNQAEDNEAFLQALMSRTSPENLLKSFEGSQAYKDFDKILNNPESLTLFNSIMDRATRQANRESARSGTLSPGTGELSGAHADLLTRLIFENAGGYHTDILNSLPLTTSANLISGSLSPQLSLASGILSQRNVAGASNPLRVIFGGADNQLFDKISELFS